MKAVLRILVALVFIASGFVKAVDPVGFSFKLEEYFGAGVFNMPQLIPLALPLAVLVSSAEVLLGLMLLLRVRLKATLAALIALCVFFAFLTFYSAYFNVVTDCGCFGDAVKFIPWQSFFKDIVLLLALVILWFLYRNDFVFEGNRRLKQILLALSAIGLVFLAYMGIRHEPIIDFRDYKIGTDMPAERRNIAASPSEYKVVYVLRNTKTGAEKRVNQDDYVNDKTLWEEGTPWEILKDRTTNEISREGYRSEISKFKITAVSGEDVTEKILTSPKAVLLFTYAPADANSEVLKAAETRIAMMDAEVKLGVAPSVELYKVLPAATMDATAIKTIARSNPFVLVLNHGKIVEKKSAEDFLND